MLWAGPSVRRDTCLIPFTNRLDSKLDPKSLRIVHENKKVPITGAINEPMSFWYVSPLFVNTSSKIMGTLACPTWSLLPLSIASKAMWGNGSVLGNKRPVERRFKSLPQCTFIKLKIEEAS